MGKSLGDYRIEISSSSDSKNIQWSKKNPFDVNDSKKKKTGKKSNISPTNILQTSKSKKDQPVIEKVFKIEDDDNVNKSKKKNTDKKFQNSSASNCNIKKDFKRPAR